MDINAYLYSGTVRVGTYSNPVYVTFATTPPSETKYFNVGEENIPIPPIEKQIIEKEVTKEVTKEVPIYKTIIHNIPIIKKVKEEKEVVKEVVKEVINEVPYYNIKGDGLAFRLWLWIGERAGWIHGR